MTPPSELSDTVLVIGHRNPDTNAVCSAIGYAAFYQWQTGEAAVACYLDDLAAETVWLLNHLHLPVPRPISDVFLRVHEVMEVDIPRLHPDQTLREAGLVLRDHAVGALPVVDPDDRLLGVLRRETLVDQYLDQLALSAEIDLRVGLIQRALNAQLLAGSPITVLRNRTLIATLTAAAVPARLVMGDIVIVGDQPDVQQAAIAARAGCLIVTDGAPVDHAVVQSARDQGTVLLSTVHTQSPQRYCCSKRSRSVGSWSTTR